ncbi:MAG TPA: ABC transporter ATP-binding protein [Steroidobacteraceae bacterium]|jgi:ABC-2 type transport system ATP-binding protein|nr:ABC transporter ATP-binding protein [Steroidobacteraceae bacterium]
MTDLAIETRALRKQFGAQVAVADLWLKVPRGEVFGFLGPNGAGKTTSIKMLLGLVPPTSGEARLLGAPLGDRRVRGRMGFLPEHFRFHECLTARELLRLHGRLQGLRGAALERRIETLLARVALSDKEHLHLRQFSKGMLQRAGLAQALIAAPELVFLDEPTSGLDPLGRVLVRELIEELRAGGTTVFLNSHLLGEVEATCDRVTFVKQGGVVREMSLKEPEHIVTAELRIDRLDSATLEGLQAFGRDARVVGGAVSLRVDSEEVMPHIARWLVGQGIAIHALGTRRKSLEEWFIEVMGEDQRPG